MKKTGLVCMLCAFMISGCAYLNKTTAFKMRNIDRTTIDVSRLEFHVTRPIGFALADDGVWLDVTITHLNDSDGHNLRLRLLQSRTAGGYHFSVDPDDLEKVQAFQEIARGWITSGKTSVLDTYFIDATGCRTDEEAVKTPTLDILVQWDTALGLRPIFHDLPISELASAAEIQALDRCSADWDR